MFKKSTFLLMVLLLTFGIQTSVSWGQPGRRSKGGNAEGKNRAMPDLPNDPKLIRIHKAFADEAMKIARDYERDRDFDSAMAVYGQVVRLIPEHTDAKTRLNLLREREKQADRILLKVDAAKTWQSTGIRLIQNKPVTILSKGTWTFTLQEELGTDGMAIPKELKEFNLGSLVGRIDTGESTMEKPFVIGTKKELIPKKSGVLYLQMFDLDVSDNEGEIDVQITGTFQRDPRSRNK
ncbi:MAG: hypothetical protein VX768_14320 [Planctomycetota bacterium]|nr:hypothetical protein [Planctomycetota bacterium]